MAELTGRELDAAVAEALGWTKHRNDRPPTSVEGAKLDWEYTWVPPGRNGDRGYRKALPRYSTDPKAAAEVLGHLVGLGYSWTASGVPVWSSAQPGVVVLLKKGLRPPRDKSEADAAAWGPDLPEAICRAALRAVGERGGEG